MINEEIINNLFKILNKLVEQNLWKKIGDILHLFGITEFLEVEQNNS